MRIILFLSILLFITACNKEKVSTCEDCNFSCLDQSEPNVYSNDCQANWECSFKVFSQSAVDLDENLGVTSGDKNVFQMLRSTEGDVNIADDEFTEILVFELDATQESFSVEGSELTNMKVHIKRICFCPNVMFNQVVEGCLQGEKQADGSWFVQGLIEGDYASGGSFLFGIDAQFLED